MSLVQDHTALSETYTLLFEQNREKLDSGSSAFINQQRDEAIKLFAKAGIPSLKNEAYKYTNLKPAFSKAYHHQFNYKEQEIELHELFKCDVPELNTHLVLLINGWYYPNNQQIGELPKGVIIGSLQQLAHTHADLMEQYFNKQAAQYNDATTYLNTAFAQDGLFIYIPKNVVIEKPIQVVNLMRSNNDRFVTQRNLIVVEENAQAKFVFCDHTLSENSFLFNTVSEIFAGDNAVVDYYIVQNQHNNTTTVNSAFFKQGTQSNLLTHTATLHGGLVRNNLKLTFDGEYAEANIYGMSFTDKNQHVDNFTTIEHAKPNCLSNQVYKNVLNENSTGAFSGQIHVVRDAQKTNAFQRNNNVLLSDTAKMQTKPQLIIEADDVKCSHGATIGRIDKDALFFLRCRGIGEAEARMMLMNAFAHEVVQNIRIDALKDRLDELVEKRLRGDLAKCHDCNYKCNK